MNSKTDKGNMKKKYYNFKFYCTLVNKSGNEEQFTFLIKSTSLLLAKDDMDKFLQDTWGWITKRVYKNECMGSDRYWSVDLIEVESL